MSKIFLGLVILSIGALFFLLPKSKVAETPKVITTPLATNFTATFEIYTNGTKRIFTDSKYHNLSPDVYLEVQNPSVVNISKSGLTWAYFFKTLPMSLDKNCLVTGTKQTFCSDDTKKLKFYINDVENPNALDLKINSKDFLKIIFQ